MANDPPFATVNHSAADLGIPKSHSIGGLVLPAARNIAEEAGFETLDGLDRHALRHSFAGVAEELGMTLPTIAALLGHSLGGVTAGYVLKRLFCFQQQS